MSQQLSLFDIEKENGLQISPEEKRQLKELYSQGYRFVTDNSESDLFPLSFWSYLPVRIKVTERDGTYYYCWGYRDKDCDKNDTLMSSPAYKFDIKSLRGLTNHHPLLISDLL